MRFRTLSADAERGETLIEVIISMLIMGVVFVAIIAGLGTSIATSVFHKKQATGQTIARDFGEYLQFTASYNDCGSIASYSGDVDNFKQTYKLPDGTTPLAGGAPTYSVALTDVQYWDGNTSPAGFGTSCGTDKGTQRLTLTVTTGTDTAIKGNLTQELQVVKRKP